MFSEQQEIKLNTDKSSKDTLARSSTEQKTDTTQASIPQNALTETTGMARLIDEIDADGARYKEMYARLEEKRTKLHEDFLAENNIRILKADAFVKSTSFLVDNFAKERNIHIEKSEALKTKWEDLQARYVTFEKTLGEVPFKKFLLYSGLIITVGTIFFKCLAWRSLPAFAFNTASTLLETLPAAVKKPKLEHLDIANHLTDVLPLTAFSYGLGGGGIVLTALFILKKLIK